MLTFVIGWMWYWGAVNLWVDMAPQGWVALFLCLFWPLTVPAAFVAGRVVR